MRFRARHRLERSGASSPTDYLAQESVLHIREQGGTYTFASTTNFSLTFNSGSTIRTNNFGWIMISHLNPQRRRRGVLHHAKIRKTRRS